MKADYISYNQALDFFEVDAKGRLMGRFNFGKLFINKSNEVPEVIKRNFSCDTSFSNIKKSYLQMEQSIKDEIKDIENKRFVFLKHVSAAFEVDQSSMYGNKIICRYYFEPYERTEPEYYI